MAAEHYGLTLIVQRSGWFDDRRIDSWFYDMSNGERGWHIRTWPREGNPIETYWVQGGEFREIIKLELPPIARIQTGRLISEMDRAKHDVIIDALKKWEKELDE